MPSSHHSFQESARINHKEGSVNPVGRRIRRAGFSASFSSEEWEEKEVAVKEKTDQEALTRDVHGHDRDHINDNDSKNDQETCSLSLESETTANANYSNSVESDTASSKTSTSGSDGHQNSLVPKWKDLFRVFNKESSKQIHSFGKSVPKLTRRKSKRIKDTMVPVVNNTAITALDPGLCYLKPSWKNYSLSEIQTATNNFSRENLIGEGGYAEVYKGQLEDGKWVAIKRLTRGSPEEMTVDFLSELGIIVHVDHPNIAKLVGYGVEGGMQLVLQLSVNGSLASILYGSREKLDWEIRYKVAVGTAEGLFYLHEGCQRRIIHKDIKASNILLTEDFEPQISDFGLAKWLPEQWTHHTVSKVEGTFGYLPPEFFMHGIVDEKTDVYAFGVLLLELITGKQAIDSSQRSLVMWAKPLLMRNNIKELVDPVLGDAYDPEQMARVICAASICIDQSSIERPQMSQVVKILNGHGDSFEQVKLQQKSKKLQRTYSEELLDADEYNSTKYLNDLNRHMEVVLGHCNESCEENGSSVNKDDANRHMEL
ncbi:hypothetical protein K2173_017588 [Erythroxylum novogranatense]|uniref:non-specific serine/threonine protein kinase n=1 Tax=Erythroxylum novogranatense TaxID=1862640 RepID=A0AAV8TNN9_9ROSI|nr:hypothetical protein K2173_017588 [Erythroxylum novogranatense]